MHRFDEDIQLARRLDDPAQSRYPERLISAGWPREPQRLGLSADLEEVHFRFGLACGRGQVQAS